MFFFLTLRESSRQPGTIEPDVLPSSSSTVGLVPGQSKSALWSTTSSFRTWLTTWDFKDAPTITRKIFCILALCFHIPLNVISIVSHGIHLLMFVWILLSLLNLLGIAYALWNLDIMRGQRLFYNKVYDRRHFDYVILGLLLVYGFSFIMFVLVRLEIHNWITFLRIIWPCLILTDIACFIAGWVANWRDVSGAPLG